MPRKYLTVDDVATLVHHRGPTTLPGHPPDTGQGATVVCLHDAGSNGKQFDAVMDHLAASHSPLAYDQPGHGRSAGLDSLGSIDAMVDHLEAVADAWALDAPVLVGEGLGAAVALQAAARRPEWPTAIVALGDAAAHYHLEDEIERLTAITSGKARREFDRSGFAPDTERSVYQTAFANWVVTDPRTTLGDRKAQDAWSIDDDSAPATPILVIVGDHTEPEASAEAAALAERLPNATVEQLAGAGRRGVLEQPEAVATLVAEFIEGASR